MPDWDKKDAPCKWPYAAQRFPVYYDEKDELVEVPREILTRLAHEIPEDVWHSDVAERIGNIQVDQDYSPDFGVLSCEDFVRIMKCAGYHEVPLWMQQTYEHVDPRTMTRWERIETERRNVPYHVVRAELRALRDVYEAAREWRLKRNPAECLPLAQALDKYHEGQNGH
jgi:hypothetical protein